MGIALGITRTVEVQIIDDDVGELDESFFLSLIPMSSENDEGLSVTITILDNECEKNRYSIGDTILSLFTTIAGFFLSYKNLWN